MIVVSGCLLGHDCKYNGGNNLNKDVVEFVEGRSYVAVCPESAGGLRSPRPPAEQIVMDGGIKVMDKEGKDLTFEFDAGASRCLVDALEYAFRHGEVIDAAILKANSPSCGVGAVYDGTFSGTLTEGDGVFARKLMDMGIGVYTENNFKENIK